MVDVSLRSYLKKVDTLIDDGSPEEAKAETRHILTHFPKNAHAYRNLGRVLVAQGQWQEAGEVLRRLLGAMPLDGVAHQLLSTVYEKLNKPEEALFHLERAFDQQPNDKAIIAHLRELYAKYRNTEVEKIQLTAGAVAGQYINNNMLDQAIDMLQKALRRFPTRTDLQVQLARALWSANQKVEAAEIALDVLKQLPYAVPANRILAELWLEQGRPTDARTYLTRIEEVDPYLAIRLATGETDENRYILPELDYRSLSQRNLSVNSPDWLSSVSQSANQSDDMAWLTDEDDIETPEVQPTIMNKPKKVTDDLPNLLDETFTDPDILTAYGTEENLSPELIARLETIKNMSGDGTLVYEGAPLGGDADADDWMKNFDIELSDAPFERKRTGLTGLLNTGALEAEKANNNDDDDFFADISKYDEPLDTDSDFFGDDANLLDESQKPVAPQSPISPQSGRTSTGFTDRIDEQNEDPDFLTELVTSTRTEEYVPSNVSGNPLAWMQEAGIELDEDAENPYEAAHRLEDDEDSSMARPTQTNPMAWMQEAGVELNAESLAGLHEEDAMAWMDDEDDDEDFNKTDLPDFLSSVESSSASDWLEDASALDDMQYLESLTTDEFAAVLSQQEGGLPENADWENEELDGFEWLSDDSDIDLEEFAGAEWAAAQPIADAVSELDWMQDDVPEDQFAWGNELDPQAEATTGFTSMLDNLQGGTQTDDGMWMATYNQSEAQIEEALSATNEYDTNESFGAVAESAIPDFFGDLDEEEFNMPDNTQSNDEFDFGDELSFSDDLLSEQDDFVLDELDLGEPIAEVDPLAWMQETDIELEGEPNAQDDFMLDDFELDDELDLGEPVAEVDPLAWMQEAGIELEGEPNAQDDFTLDDFELDDELDLGEPVAEVDPLAWMQEAGIELEDEPIALDDFALDDFELDDEPIAQDDFALDDFDFDNEMGAKSGGLLGREFFNEPTANEFVATDDGLEDDAFAFDNMPMGDDEFAFDDVPTTSNEFDFGNEFVPQNEFQQEDELGNETEFTFDEPVNDRFTYDAQDSLVDENSDWLSSLNLSEDSLEEIPDATLIDETDGYASAEQFGILDEELLTEDLLGEDYLVDEFDFSDEAIAQNELSLDELGFDNEFIAEDELDFDDDFLVDDELSLDDEAIAQSELNLDELDFGTELIAEDELSFDDNFLADDELSFDNEFSNELLAENQLDLDDSFYDDTDDELEAEPIAENVPDWLQGIGEELPLEDEMDVEGFEYDQEHVAEGDYAAEGLLANEYDFVNEYDESPLPYDDSMAEPVSEEEADWLASIGMGAAASGVVAAAIANDNPEETQFDWSNTSESEENYASAVDETSIESESHDYSATNAPDWLNAMVPGLDVDYENLSTDDLVEDGFHEGKSHHERNNLEEFTAVNEDFNWLQDIVDEETQNIDSVAVRPLPPNVPLPPPPSAPLPVPNIAPATAPNLQKLQPTATVVESTETVTSQTSRNYRFSRLPAWIANLRQAKPTPTVVPDEDDDDGFDVTDFDDMDFDEFDNFDDDKK